MSIRNWKLRIEDIVEAISNIERYTNDLSWLEWKEDQKTIDAVIRNMQVIGEAANYVPEIIRVQHPEVPWSKMRGMRNILVHEYFGIDSEILWKTITEDLPGLKKDITSTLKNELSER